VSVDMHWALVLADVITDHVILQCRAESTKRSLVLSSRVLVQRACKNSAVQVYRYDADGKLTADETDITSWEERNTEIYGWLNTDPPPFEPRQPVNRFRRGAQSAATGNDPTNLADYEALLDRMSSEVRAVAPLKSSTVSSTNRQETNKLHSNAERVDGSQRSHSEHCITLKSSVQTAADHVDQKMAVASGTKPTSTTTKNWPATPAVNKGRLMWTPQLPATTTSIASSTNTGGGGRPKPGFVKPSPVGSRVASDVGTVFAGTGGMTSPKAGFVPSLTSLADRQRKRCMENRVRKATGKQGPHQHLSHQQQQLHQQRQWRHVDWGKNY